jgi:hypothetical protein
MILKKLINKMMKAKCDECGAEFSPGNREDGLPNGVSFHQKDGSMYTICADCLIKKGRELCEK